MKAIQTVKTILAIVGLFAIGILTGALLARKPTAKKDGDAEKAKEEKKDEIESTPADALVSDADNADELRADKERIKADFRERIRHRLNEELHRLGSLGADSDSGTGSRSSD